MRRIFIEHFADDREDLVHTRDITWGELRQSRNNALAALDFHALQDREMSDEIRIYRVFLRELPQNHPGDNANDAVDAWTEYDVPEVE